MTPARKTARRKKPEPKSTADSKPAAGKSKKKAAASVKTAPPNPQHLTWSSPPKIPPPLSRKFLNSTVAYPSKHLYS